MISIEGGPQTRDSVRVKFRVKICIFAFTAATIIWRNADKKHEENNPKLPRQTNLRALMYGFTFSLHLHACVWLALAVQSAIDDVCVLPSCFILVSAIMRNGAQKAYNSLFVMHGTSPDICDHTLCVMVCGLT